MQQDEQHPIVAGLAALVVVAIVIGVVGGIAMLVGTRAAGLGGHDSSSKSAEAHASLYAPSPSPTEREATSSISLLPTVSATGSARVGGSGESGEAATTSPTTAATPSAPAEKESKPDKKITLQAAAPSARPMEMVDLSGIYPGGEGAILRLERNDGSGWKDFGIPDVNVVGEQFSTKIQTGRTGTHRFRMRDVDSHAVSNVVTVNIG